MAIRFTCGCGREITVPDDREGQVSLCPSCKREVRAPDRPRPAPPGAGNAPGGESDSKRKKLKKRKEGKKVKKAKKPKNERSEGSPRSEAGDGATPPEEKDEGGESVAALFQGAIAAFQEVQGGAPGGDAPGGSEDSEGPAADRAAPREEPDVPAAPPSGGADVSAEEPEETGRSRSPVQEDEPPEPAGVPSPGKGEREEERPAKEDGPAPSREEPAVKEEGGGRESAAREADDERARKDAPVEKDADGAHVSAAKAEPDVPAAPSPEEKDGQGTKDALPADDAVAMIERRQIEKAIRREGEPESPAGAYEPKDVEVADGVMKFHCRCGKRISVPVDAKKTIGRCPKCGSRLVVPKASRVEVEQAGEKASAPQKRGHGKARKRGLRRAADAAADRLRTHAKTPDPAEASALAPAESSPSWAARFGALQMDATIVATVLFGGFFVLNGIGFGKNGLAVAAVLAAAVWIVNRVLLLYLAAASVGMKLAGLALRRQNGRPMSFGRTVLRAAAGVVLLPLAPLALRDPERRTLADRAAGTKVVQAGR